MSPSESISPIFIGLLDNEDENTQILRKFGTYWPTSQKARIPSDVFTSEAHFIIRGNRTNTHVNQ
jgi:hypothetical protein